MNVRHLVLYISNDNIRSTDVPWHLRLEKRYISFLRPCGSGSLSTYKNYPNMLRLLAFGYSEKTAIILYEKK